MAAPAEPDIKYVVGGTLCGQGTLFDAVQTGKYNSEEIWVLSKVATASFVPEPVSLLNIIFEAPELLKNVHAFNTEGCIHLYKTKADAISAAESLQPTSMGKAKDKSKKRSRASGVREDSQAKRSKAAFYVGFQKFDTVDGALAKLKTLPAYSEAHVAYRMDNVWAIATDIEPLETHINNLDPGSKVYFFPDKANAEKHAESLQRQEAIRAASVGSYERAQID